MGWVWGVDQNGILLRSDFHKLFDTGLVTVTPVVQVQVSDRIQEHYFNGKAYYSLHDKQLAVIPKLDSQRPNTIPGAALEGTICGVRSVSEASTTLLPILVV